jgi:hypothetical protein
MKLNAAVTCLAVLSLAACSSDPESPSGGAGTGGMPQGGSSGGPTAGLGGGGAAMGGGGAGTAGASIGGGGGGGVGGGGAGGASGGGAGGMSGSGAGGGGFWGPNGPKKQWTCPAGPFGEQTRSNEQTVCQGFAYNYGYNEGPTWIASENAFFFSNFIQGGMNGGDIIKYTPGGSCEVWKEGVGCNGLGVSPSGNLLGACHGSRAVLEFDLKTKQSRVIASMVDGKKLDSPNDLVAHSNGTIYFSNTTFELDEQPELMEALVMIDPMGKTSVIEAGGLNGVALSPDEKKLYVVGKGVWNLDDQGKPLAKMGGAPGGDGLAVDCAGNVTNDQTNSAYGGLDGKTLFVVQGKSARTYSVTIPGLP